MKFPFPKLSKPWRALALIIVTLFALGAARSDLLGCDACTPKQVSFQGLACVTGPFHLDLNGATSANTDAGNVAGNYSISAPALTQLVLNTEYTMTFTGNFVSLHIAFSGLGSCYTVRVKGGDYTEWTPTTTLDYVGLPNGGQVQVMVTYCKTGSAGDGSTYHKSVHWRSSLGYSGATQAAGELTLDQPAVTSLTYSPSQLKLSALTSNVDVITVGGVVRQVRAPDSLVDVVVGSASQYEARFYRSADVLAKVDGLYPVADGAQPSVVWRIENPVPGNPDSGQVLISEIRNGVTVQSSIFTTSGNTSTYARGGGKSVETRVTSYDAITNDRSVVITLQDDANVVASSVQESYHVFPWGEELVKQIDDFGGTPRQTTWSYFQDANAPASYQRLSLVQRADGSWARYEYSYLVPGFPATAATVLQTLTYEPWGAASPATPQAATAANSKVTTTISAPNTIHNGSTEYQEDNWTLPASGGPIAAGHIIHLRDTSGVIYDNNYWNATAFTIQATHQNNVGGYPEYNRPAWVEYPDGRADYFGYTPGTYDAATHTFTAVDGGSALSTTILHSQVANQIGIPLKSTRDTQISDEKGNLVIVRTEVCQADGSFALLSERLSDYNADSQLAQTTLNGRVVLQQSWVNNLKQSDTDESGVVTTYLYDPLGRVASETRTGVAAAGSFAAQPDLLTTYTYDAAGNVLSTTRSAGGLSLTSSTVFTGGRPSSKTDENGLVTGIGYSADGLTTTTTRPDGGTEIVVRNRDGQVSSISGTGVITRTYVYAVDSTTGNSTTTEYVGPAGAASPRWVKTEMDWSGRGVQETKPASVAAPVVAMTAYNAQGQPASVTRAGYAAQLSEYDAVLGSVSRAGLDLDANGVLDPASADRITDFASGYLQSGGQWYRYDRTSEYGTTSNSAPSVIRETRSQLTGLPANGVMTTISIDALGNQTVTTVTADRVNRTQTETVQVLGSTLSAVSVTRNGLLQSQSTSTLATPTTYTYDALGRIQTVTDPRGAVTTAAYFAGQNLVSSVLDSLNQTTSYTYYGQGVAGAGMISTQTNADASVQRKSYTQLGSLTRVWGTGDYPVEYLYDTYGDRTVMRTYRTDAGWSGATWPGGTPDTTTWTRQPATGLITAKTDAASPAGVVAYIYSDTANYRLTKRTWARGLFTTFGYDATTGELKTTTYSDGTTPAVTMNYDRRGRLAGVIDGAGTRVLGYDAVGLASEDFTAGALAGIDVTVTRDAMGRFATVRGAVAGHTFPQAGYSYSPVNGRLQDVTVQNVTVHDVMGHDATAHYSYEQTPQSDAVAAISFQRLGAERFATARLYDALGRPSSTTHQAVGLTLAKSASGLADYDPMNRRTKRADENGNYWQYAYDLRGEVQDGEKHLGTGAPLAGWQFGYGYDAIGNRTSTDRGGDSAGANRRNAPYTPNAVNAYTGRTVPGYFDVVGTSTPDAVITVNGLATERQSAEWRKEIAVANTSAAVSTTVTVAGSRSTYNASKTGKVFTPKAAEVYTYDLDGNLLTDGRFIYTWDAENRLLTVQTSNAAALAGAAGIKRLFAYDYLGRRISKTNYATSGSPGAYTYGLGTGSSVSRNLYSGWNLLAEIDATGVPLRCYTWGLDLSGSLEGASGVGGLLFVENFAGGTSTLNAAATDEMGNVVALADMASGALTASYEYGPFGEVMRQSGPLAASNPIRWSSRYTDDETGLVAYPLRVYNPSTGRWISRDPMGEEGGSNLYVYSENDGVNTFDPLGALRWPWNWFSRKRPKKEPALALALKDQLYSSVNRNTRLRVRYLKTGEEKMLSLGEIAQVVKCASISITAIGKVLVDVDGTGPDHGDPDANPDHTTSYRPGGISLNADKTAYAVAPRIMSWDSGNGLSILKPGARVTVSANGRTIDAVAGDFGPNSAKDKAGKNPVFGELSYKAVQDLGIVIHRPWNNPATGDYNVTIIYYPKYP